VIYPATARLHRAVAGTFQFKKSIQKAVFPEGMVVKADTKRVLTDNIEELFYIVGYFSKNYKHKKSGRIKC
jgi:hypothetical protein